MGDCKISDLFIFYVDNAFFKFIFALLRYLDK